MPRQPRASIGGLCYHVHNSGHGSGPVFHTDADYRTFHTAIAHARKRVSMRLLAYCLLPDKFQLVLWPHADGDLSRWMHLVLNAHVRRFHAHSQHSGPVWRGRFKAFPIQIEDPLLAVLRHVEASPLRAHLVERAELWPWSSLVVDPHHTSLRLTPWPVPRPGDWIELVNLPQPDVELATLRESLARGTPFGHAEWVHNTALRLNLTQTLHPRGRPRKKPVIQRVATRS